MSSSGLAIRGAVALTFALALLSHFPTPAEASGGLEIEVSTPALAPANLVTVSAMAPPATAVVVQVSARGPDGIPGPPILVLTKATDARGVATFTFRLPTDPGTYEVFASVNATAYAYRTLALAPVPAPPENNILPSAAAFGLIGLAVFGAVAIASPRLHEALGFLLLIPLFSRLRKGDVKSQYSRGRLIQLIEDSPGINYTSIRRRSGLSNGNCAYHLRVLERSGEIRRVAHGATVCFYPADYKADAESLPPLAFVQRKLLEVLSQGAGGTAADLRRELNRQGVEASDANVGYHLRSLARDKKLISHRREGGRAQYFLDAEQKAYVKRRLAVEFAVDQMLEHEAQEPEATRVEALPGAAALFIGPQIAPPGVPPFLLEAIYLFTDRSALLHIQGNPRRVERPPPSTPMLRTVQADLAGVTLQAGRFAEVVRGEHEILFLASDHFVVAVTIFGEPTPDLEKALMKLSQRLESLYGNLVASTGEGVKVLPEVETQVLPVFQLVRSATRDDVRRVLAAEPVGTRADVAVAEGQVRVTFRLRNHTAAIKSALGLELDFDEEALSLVETVPEAPWVRGRYQLSDLDAFARTSVDFIFERRTGAPLVIEANLRFRNERGESQVARLPRVDVRGLGLVGERGSPFAPRGASESLLSSTLAHRASRSLEYPEGMTGADALAAVRAVALAAGLVAAETTAPAAARSEEAWMHPGGGVAARRALVRASVDHGARSIAFIAASNDPSVPASLLEDLAVRLTRGGAEGGRWKDLVRVDRAPTGGAER